MRWFRRRNTEPPQPTPAAEVKPVVVDVEPAAESTATIPSNETVDPAPDPSHSTTPQPVATAPDPEPASLAPPKVTATAPPPPDERRPMRHWHLAGAERRLPSARPPGATRVANGRASSDGWHRV